MNEKYKKVMLSDSRKQGSSLPLVICVAAFMLAFSLALVYTSGLLMARVNKKADQERCYQLASSFAKEMEQELKTPKSEFQEFANQFLDSPDYNEYNPDNPSTVYHYIAEDSADDSYGVMKMRLYKEFNADEKDIYEGSLYRKGEVGENADFTALVAERQNQIFQRYIFKVEMIAEYGDVEYNYPTEYFREDKYAVEFYHNGHKIVWDSQAVCWKIETTAGEVYDGWAEQDAEPIQYKYLLDKPISPVYKNIYEESGMIPESSVPGGGSQ